MKIYPHQFGRAVLTCDGFAFGFAYHFPYDQVLDNSTLKKVHVGLGDVYLGQYGFCMVAEQLWGKPHPRKHWL